MFASMAETMAETFLQPLPLNLVFIQAKLLLAGVVSVTSFCVTAAHELTTEKCKAKSNYGAQKNFLIALCAVRRNPTAKTNLSFRRR